MFVVGDTFNTFEELRSKIKEYEEKNLMNFYVRDCMTMAYVKRMNKPRARLCNDNLRYYKVTFACTKGGRTFKSTSKGLRRMPTLLRGCNVRIEVAVNDQCQLYIKEFVEDHNHELSKFSYKLMRKNKRLNEEEKKMILQLAKKKTSNRDIQTYLVRNCEKLISLKAIRNVKLSVKASEMENYLPFVFEKLEMAGDTVKVLCRDTDEKVKAIYYQDEKMKASFKAYPEVLICDCTYMLNSLKMVLYLLLVVDGNGSSEIVCTFLVADECEKTLGVLLDTFKTLNKSWNLTKTIFTDKDMEERQIFKKEFPSTTLLLCLYHTLQTFSRDITEEKMDLSSKDREVCLDTILKIAYCKNETEYNKYYNSLVDLNFAKVTAYYNKNWHDIRQEWVDAFRQDSLTLQNRASNRLELVNKKLKAPMNKVSSFQQFFKTFKRILRSLRKGKERVVSDFFKPLKGDITKYKEDSPEYQYHQLITPFAWKHLKVQFDLKKTSHIIQKLKKVDNDTYTFKSVDGRMVQVSLHNCECGFFKQMQLPCCHVLATSEKLNSSPFDETLIDTRWLRKHYINNFNNECTQASNSPKVDQHQEALNLCSKLSCSMVKFNSVEFEKKMEQVKLLLNLYKNKKEVFVVEDAEKCDNSSYINNSSSDS